MTTYTRLQARNILSAILDNQLEPEHSKAVQSDNVVFAMAISYVAFHGSEGIKKAVRYMVVQAFKNNLVRD